MARPDGGRGDGALTVQAAAWRGEATLAWFAGTMLLGAFLVFSIQPLFARMALPLLGGAPAVWNTAMVFFQSALLAGYAYAHCLSRCLGPRGQIAGHLSLLALASLSLPVAIGGGWEPPAGAMSIPWLIALMAWTVGLPFLAVAATAPLIQRWFADSGHAAAGDPYFLYGASNLGSILALLSYPLLVEPTLTLHQQGWLWAAGYGALALAITGCGLMVWRPRLRRLRRDARQGRRGGRGDRLAAPAALARARAGPVQPAARGDDPHHHRSGGRAVTLGGAARAVSPDLRRGLRAPAVAAPRLDGQGPAVRRHPAGPAVHLEPAVLAGPAAAPARPVRQRAGLPRRARAPAAGVRAPDRVLFLDGGGRCAGRRLHGPARAAPVRRACSSIRSRWWRPACSARRSRPAPAVASWISRCRSGSAS